MLPGIIFAAEISRTVPDGLRDNEPIPSVTLESMQIFIDKETENKAADGVVLSNSQISELHQVTSVAEYYVPGIGVVTLLVTGAYLVGDKIYKAGSSVCKIIKNYLAKAEKKK